MDTAAFKKAMYRNGATQIALWFLLVALLTGATLYFHHIDQLKEARNEARDYYRLNLFYRSWSAKLGGVYAPVGKVAPNPYLKVARRDVTTSDGQQLTLVNPAYMTRMVFDSIKESSPGAVISKLTSLKPLNPANAADAWEREALLAFRQGEGERFVTTSVNGRPYLRFIARFVTEKACLACHEWQGYRLGDVQGGITISIPLAGYYASESATRGRLLAGYLLIWGVGSLGIVTTSRRRAAYEDELRDGEEKFRTVCDWTQDWEYWMGPGGALKYMSPSCRALTGYGPEEFLQDPELLPRLVHPEDRALFETHLNRPPDPDQVTETLQFRVVAKDGTVRWIQHVCRPVFSKLGYEGRRVSNRDVTEQKKNERELAIRAELLNGVSDSVLVLDRQGRILDANDAAWRSRGFSREELLSLDIHALSAGRAPDAGEGLKLTFALGSAFFESEQVLKNGDPIAVEVNNRVIDYRGQPAVLSSIRDITRRKETEESLRRSERFNVSLNRISQAFLTSRGDDDMYRELLATVLDIMQSPYGMVGYLDPSGALVCPTPIKAPWTESEERQSVAVYPPESWGESLWGRTLRAGVAHYDNHACDLPRWHEGITRALSVPLMYQERPIGLVLVANARKDYRDEDLQMLQAIGDQVAPVLQARLEQQQAMAALKENERTLRVIFDVMQAGIIEVDASGRVCFANQRMAEMLGLAMPDLLGSEYLSHICPDQVETVRGWLPRQLSGEADYIHCERHFLRRDGSDFWGYLSGRRLASPDGKRISLVGTVSDMTELKTAEEKRHRTEQRMLHVQKLESLGVLAGGIAHDFNNILLAIMGNASLALQRVDPGTPVEHHLRQVEAAAGKAADLARQMLAYSGKGRFVVEALDLNQLIREMSAMLEVSVSKKAPLRLRLAPHLPSIVADPTQMRQIVMNLAINASEAIGEKSGVISLATGCMECDGGYLSDTWLNDNLPAGLYVFLEVADTGCGMNRETVERIFEPFFTTKFTGRGLGMAAILGIIRGHKGAIKVYSEPGRGTTFRILIPASDRPPEFCLPESVPEGWRGTGTVLLVDDEETVRQLGTDMLTELGFTVLCAADGMEALRLYRKKRQEISLVLMDLTMPRLNGEEAFRELRRVDPKVRVILSSGFGEQEVTRKFTGKGLAGFVQKPYTLATLRNLLYRLE